MTKSTTAVILVLIIIIASPIAIGIVSALFGVISGLFGAIVGIISGVFSAFFGVIGGIIGSGWIPVLILAVIIAAVLSGRR